MELTVRSEGEEALSETKAHNMAVPPKESIIAVGRGWDGVKSYAAILSHTFFKVDYVAGVYIGITFALPIILPGFKKFHGMSLMKYLEVTKKKRGNPVLIKRNGQPCKFQFAMEEELQRRK